MNKQFKYSGCEWIGEIPIDWEVGKVKMGFKRKNSKAYEENPTVLSLTRQGVRIRDISTGEGQIAASYYEYNPVSKNDLLLNPMDLYSGANCTIADVEGVISPAYVNLKSEKGFNPLFYDYYFKVQYWTMAFFAHGKGVSFENRWTLNTETLMNFPILIPPEEEQNKIANYLSDIIQKLDKIILKYENIIIKYKEYKQSLITEVITTGLNKNVELIESPAPWMPLIPKHWRIDKFKFHLQVDEQKGFPDLEVLSLYREYGVIPKKSRDDNHNVTSEDTSNYKHVTEGNFVVNKMKAWQGSVAVSTYEGIVSPAYYIYKFTSEVFNPKYFHYLMRNKSYTPEFRRLSAGIREGQWDLSRYALENILILIPPLTEQEDIVKFLDEKCDLIDSIITEKEQLISALEEYKRSLIFEFVTGKKEVPE